VDIEVILDAAEAGVAHTTPHGQTRPDTPLPRPASGRPDHCRPARPPRPRHRADPGRSAHPRTGRKPKTWTAADRDYETIRIGMQTLFRHVGIETLPSAA